VVDKLNAAVSKMASQPDEAGLEQQRRATGDEPQVFDKYARDDIAKWARVAPAR
jgi:hypothetical protein